MPRCVLAIDEGSTGVRAMLFTPSSQLIGSAYEEIGATFPQPGWVEQDPELIWTLTHRVVGLALDRAKARPRDVAAIGIANQRATALVWERRSGRPVYPAISWQDLRTAARVNEILAE